MIDSLKDLEKLLKLCRKQGVTEIELGTISFKLGDLPETRSTVSTIEQEIDQTNPYENFPTGELTPTQLMYYSSGGDPANDPELAENQQ